MKKKYDRQRVIILTEGDTHTIGFGHISRSIALQHALTELGFQSSILIKGEAPKELIKGIVGQVFDWSKNFNYMNDNFIYVLDVKNEYEGYEDEYHVTNDIARIYKPVRKEFWNVRNKIRHGEFTTLGGTKDKKFITASKMTRKLSRAKSVRVGAGQTLWEVLACKVPIVEIELDENLTEEHNYNIETFKQYKMLEIYNPKTATLHFAKFVLRMANKFEIIPFNDRYLESVRKLRNQKSVRKYSQNKFRISKKHNKMFYDNDYNRENTYLYINNAQELIGYVRMDERHYISLAIDKKYYGIGIGETLIKFIQNEYPLVKAIIHKDNYPSVSLFKRCRFAQSITTEDTGNFRNLYYKNNKKDV